MPKSKVGIVGAGVLGRLLALKLNAQDWEVTLFDRLEESAVGSCSHAAGGMLAPYSELESSELEIFKLGEASLELWPGILREFDLEVFFQREGSLVVAHPYDLPELARFRRALTAKIGERNIQDVSGSELLTLEPELDRKFMSGIFLPMEGQIGARGVVAAMGSALRKRGVQCHYGQEVQLIKPGEVSTAGNRLRFDLVLDCRGLGAKEEMSGLRSVRGELIYVQAPDVRFTRPIRVLHPRFPLYVVPRPGGKFLIGATSVESEDSSPISVRSTLELLSAAFALNSSFGEARIIQTVVGLRPAFSDHLPRIERQDGLIRVNGLYRHGFLVSPKIAERVCESALEYRL